MIRAIHRQRDNREILEVHLTCWRCNIQTTDYVIVTKLWDLPKCWKCDNPLVVDSHYHSNILEAITHAEWN